MPGERDLVVLQENDAGLFAGHTHDPGHDVLARLVGGMRLTGEKNLHGPLRVAQKLREPGSVPEQQVRPLVGSEATAESNGQRVEVELPRRLCSFVRESEQPPLELAMDSPKIRSRNLTDIDFKCG